MEQTNHLKRWVILFIVLGSLVIILNFVLTHGLATIQLSDPVQKGATGTFILSRVGQEAGEPQEVELPFSQTKLLKTGLYQLSLTNGREETVTYFRVGRLNTTEVSTATARQSSSHKIGAKSFGCELAQNNVVYSHSCTTYGQVYRHNPVTPGNLTTRVPLSPLALTLVRPYRSGFLAVAEGGGDIAPYLVHKNTLGSDSPTQIPTNGDIVDIVVDSQEKDSELFAVVFDDRILVYANAGDTSPTEIKLPEDLTGQQLDKSFMLQNNVVTAYFGLRTYGPDSEEEEDAQKSFNGGALVQYDAISGKQSDRIDLPKSLRAFRAIKLGARVMFVDEFGFEVYENAGQKLGGLVAKGDPITSLVQTGDKSIAFISNDRVYQMDVEALSQTMLFGVDRLNLSGISHQDGGIIVSAFVADDPAQVLHVYKLGQDAPVFPRRETVLPLNADVSSVQEMDYNDVTKQVTVVLALNSLSFDASRGPIFDIDEVNRKKDRVRELLNQEGAQLKGYTINFPGY